MTRYISAAMIASFALAFMGTSAANGQSSVRFATFNASMNRFNAGDLIDDLSTPNDTQAQSVAEIIQKINPDVILINEFDYDAAGQAAQLFQTNYLGVSQNGSTPINFPHVYVPPSNTGVPSGLDLDNSGGIGGAGDAYGFGFFEGQFGFAIFSKYDIDEAAVRTFQNFLWKDMPSNFLTDDPTASPNNLADYYSAAERDALRLSSKNHVDVPIIVGGQTIHALAAHPTPPVFDGSEDRNGKRNHDEIRFWADYVDGQSYIYDDAGTTGGLGANESFVILGDYNADPFDGDSTGGAIDQLLDHPAIVGSATDASITPASLGGAEQAGVQGGANNSHTGNPAFDTADFGDGAPGNLRVDYALPSVAGLNYEGGGVFWPESSSPDFALASNSTSDHRLVYVDLSIVPEPTSISMASTLAVMLASGSLRVSRRSRRANPSGGRRIS